MTARLLPPLLMTLLLTIAGCVAAPTAPPERSLYERLGGREAITAVVIDAFGNISTDQRINQRFAKTDASKLAGNLVDLICERTGGPCVYKGVNMADSHEGMHIRDEEFDALVENLLKSMQKFKVSEREQRESVEILGKMRNAIVGH
jgi:hemoglobin